MIILSSANWCISGGLGLPVLVFHDKPTVCSAQVQRNLAYTCSLPCVSTYCCTVCI